MNYTLIYDADCAETVEEDVLPLVRDLTTGVKVYQEEVLSEISAEERLLLYLSDEQIKMVLPMLLERKTALAILPHPEARRFCAFAGVETSLKKAVQHLEAHDGETIAFDLLYCNGDPVFSSVVIGSPFQLTTSKYVGFWKRLKNFVVNFLSIRPMRLHITRKNDEVLKTAASGIVVVPHKTDHILSGYIPWETSFNDGMLHALLVCPRSLLELLGFALRPFWVERRLPHFGAHIKTSSITFSAPQGELNFIKDGNTYHAENVHFELKKKHLEIVPGSLIQQTEETTSNEVFKVQALPTGEAANELSLRRLPFMKRASTEEFKQLFQVLRDNARVKTSYMVLMVLSTALATLGLFSDSSPVVIGAMILAPLMSPIISMSMASLRQDKKLILDSMRTILAGLGIGFVFAVIITLATPIYNPNAEILARTSPNLLDLGVAVISGIAGAYAHAREQIAKTLAGVAIAVALVPPLAVAGIGLGWLDWEIFSGALLLLSTNLAGMVLSASVTFLVLGFSPFKLATNAVFISLLVVLIFSIPLALSFNRMLYEHNVRRSLSGWETKDVILREVNIRSTDPLHLSVKFVSPKSLDYNEIDAIKSKIEKKLGKEVVLEVTVALKR